MNGTAITCSEIAIYNGVRAFREKISHLLLLIRLFCYTWFHIAIFVEDISHFSWNTVHHETKTITWELLIGLVTQNIYETSRKDTWLQLIVIYLHQDECDWEALGAAVDGVEERESECEWPNDRVAAHHEIVNFGR